jgi:hypothetical protein
MAEASRSRLPPAVRRARENDPVAEVRRSESREPHQSPRRRAERPEAGEERLLPLPLWHQRPRDRQARLRLVRTVQRV